MLGTTLSKNRKHTYAFTCHKLKSNNQVIDEYEVKSLLRINFRPMETLSFRCVKNKESYKAIQEKQPNQSASVILRRDCSFRMDSEPIKITLCYLPHFQQLITILPLQH